MSAAEIIPLADTWGMHGDVGWGWMALMMVVMVVFWGAVIFGIVWLVRAVARGGPAQSVPSADTIVGRETPLQLLDRRFAEGAISAEDYRARRDVLVKRTPARNGGLTDTPSVPYGAGK